MTTKGRITFALVVIVVLVQAIIFSAYLKDKNTKVFTYMNMSKNEQGTSTNCYTQEDKYYCEIDGLIQEVEEYYWED